MLWLFCEVRVVLVQLERKIERKKTSIVLQMWTIFMENEIIWARRIAMTFTDDHPFRFIIVTLMTTLNLHTHARIATANKINWHLMTIAFVVRHALNQPSLNEFNWLISWFILIFQILPARNSGWWSTHFERWHRTRCHSFSECSRCVRTADPTSSSKPITDTVSLMQLN